MLSILFRGLDEYRQTYACPDIFIERACYSVNLAPEGRHGQDGYLAGSLNLAMAVCM